MADLTTVVKKTRHNKLRSWRTTRKQSYQLERLFQEESKPNVHIRESIAQKVGLTKQKVLVSNSSLHA